MKCWPMHPLGGFCSVVADRASEGTTPYLEIGNLDTRTKTYKLSKKPAMKGALFAKAGDVIVSRVRPTRGAITLVNEKQLAISSGFTILRPHHEVAQRFLFFALAWNNIFLNYLGRHSKGALYPTVPEKDVIAFKIPVPPLAEQELIMKLLGEANELRKLRAQADRRTADLIPALFHEMFGDPARLEEMPWKSKPISAFAEVCYGLADKLDSSTKPDNGTRILTISNVLLNGSIDASVEKYSVADDKKKKKAQLQNCDLLFNWRNGSEEHVGKTAIWEGQIKGEILHVSFLLRIRIDQSQSDPYFLWVLLNRMRATGFFKRNTRMQINRKYNASELSALKLPLPPLPLQKEFAKRVNDIREMEAGQSASRRRLEELFQALLYRAFNGEL